MPRVEGFPIPLPDSHTRPEAPESEPDSSRIFPIFPTDKPVYLYGGGPIKDGKISKREPEKDFLRRETLLVIKNNEFTQKVQALPHLPGVEVRYDEDGNIYYATWQQRDEIKKPEIYLALSEMRDGWSLATTLRLSPKKPISEKIFHQIRKDGGSVEAAIRSVGHIIDEYDSKRGEEAEEIRVFGEKVDDALIVLSQYPEDQDQLLKIHREVLAAFNQYRAHRYLLEEKKQLVDFLDRGTRGKDVTNRPNPAGMVKILKGSRTRIGLRMGTVRAIRSKYAPMRAALVEERNNSREILESAETQLGITRLGGHSVILGREKETTDLQREILTGMMNFTLKQLAEIKLKPYRPVAKQVTESLEKAQQHLQERRYGVVKVIINKAQARVSEVLAEYAEIETEGEESV